MRITAYQSDSFIGHHSELPWRRPVAQKRPDAIIKRPKARFGAAFPQHLPLRWQTFRRRRKPLIASCDRRRIGLAPTLESAPVYKCERISLTLRAGRRGPSLEETAMPSRFLLAPLSVALSMVLASPAWAGPLGV